MGKRIVYLIIAFFGSHHTFSQRTFYVGGAAGMYSYRYFYENIEPFLYSDKLKKFTPFSPGPFYSFRVGMGINLHHFDCQVGFFEYRWHDFPDKFTNQDISDWHGSYLRNANKALNVGLQYRYNLFASKSPNGPFRLYPVAGWTIQSPLQPTSRLGLGNRYKIDGYKIDGFEIEYSHTNTPILIGHLGAEAELKILKGLSVSVSYTYYHGFANQMTSRFSFRKGNKSEVGYQRTNGSGQYLAFGLRYYLLAYGNEKTKKRDLASLEKNKHSFYVGMTYGAFRNRWSTTNPAHFIVANNWSSGFDKVSVSNFIGYRCNKSLYEIGIEPINSYYYYQFNEYPQTRGEFYAWLPLRYKRVAAAAFSNRLEIVPFIGTGPFIHVGFTSANRDAVERGQLAGYNQSLNRFVWGMEGGAEATWTYRKMVFAVYGKYIHGFKPSHYLHVRSPQGTGTVYAYLQGPAFGMQVRYHIRKKI